MDRLSFTSNDKGKLKMTKITHTIYTTSRNTIENSQMKPNSTWYANSQPIRILMMSVISGHVPFHLIAILHSR